MTIYIWRIGILVNTNLFTTLKNIAVFKSNKEAAVLDGIVSLSPNVQIRLSQKPNAISKRKTTIKNRL